MYQLVNSINLSIEEISNTPLLSQRKVDNREVTHEVVRNALQARNPLKRCNSLTEKRFG